MMKELDLLLLMKRSIEGFEQTPLNLESLLLITGNLEDLLDKLKNVSHEWKESFRTEWWELELISAVLMDNEETEISNDGREKIFEATEKMKTMIDEEYQLQSSN